MPSPPAPGTVRSASDQSAAELGQHGLPVHVLPWDRAADEAGLAEDALYLVRPDGHLALADPKQDPEALGRYLARFHLHGRG